MFILAKTDYKKVKDDKNTQAFFLIWLSFSIITVFAFYFQIAALSNIDIPTHIGAGLVIAAFIFSTIKVKNGREALILAFVPFLLWELIELEISIYTHSPFLFRLFHETIQNKTQDVIMDVLGFLIYVKMTGKRF